MSPRSPQTREGGEGFLAYTNSVRVFAWGVRLEVMADSCAELETDPVGDDLLFKGAELEVPSLSYVPSIHIDFCGGFPHVHVESAVELSQGHDVDAVVSSSWNSLRSDDFKLPWETHFSA